MAARRAALYRMEHITLGSAYIGTTRPPLGKRYHTVSNKMSIYTLKLFSRRSVHTDYLFKGWGCMYGNFYPSVHMGVSRTRPVWESIVGVRGLNKQESCAIAKMTAQCAQYMVALKIFGTP